MGGIAGGCVGARVQRRPRLGWWECPAVEKAARWLAGGQVLLGMRAVGLVHSVEKVECVDSRGEGVASGVMWAGQWGVGSNQEGMGKAWAVGGMGGGSRGASWWVAGQKYCIGEELELRDNSFHVCGMNQGVACSKQSGDSKVGGWLLVDSQW